jgi:hypothetical protein
MFIRKKQTKRGTAVYYLVESQRVNGKVRQRSVAYLGRENTIESAIAEVNERIDFATWAVERAKPRRYRCSWKRSRQQMEEHQIGEAESRLRMFQDRLAKLQAVVTTVFSAVQTIDGTTPVGSSDHNCGYVPTSDGTTPVGGVSGTLNCLPGKKNDGTTPGGGSGVGELGTR